MYEPGTIVEICAFHLNGPAYGRGSIVEQKSSDIYLIDFPKIAFSRLQRVHKDNFRVVSPLKMLAEVARENEDE